MPREMILIVEDEADILELMAYNLKREGYALLTADTGEQGLALARSKTPDLVLLDLMLPGMDGLAVCRELQADPATAAVPVVMVTAKGAESDIVAGLELGAADYITKPFGVKVLVARVRAVLRRRGRDVPGEDAVLKIGDIVIHPGRHEVRVKGKPTELTATEFRLLQMLARRPGWVYTRDRIVEAVRGTDCAVTARAVDVQVVGLRKKLGASGACVETVRGVGYRFKE
ncbi:MAG: response regulator transcription factor [Planctomycetota bacterium]